MLKKIEEKVALLVGQGSSILCVNDQLRDALDAVDFFKAGTFSRAEPRKANLCYQRSREINDLYRAWYSVPWPLVSANLPERLQEFESLYDDAATAVRSLTDVSGVPQRKSIVAFEVSFSGQLGHVRSIPAAIESKALALKGILARDLMGDELNVATGLLTNGFVREAGVVAGIVLERHLKLLCEKHSIHMNEKETLGSLNVKLRERYPDDSEFRRVQFLNEVRASCTHDKDVPPDAEKVGQLLSGVRGFVSSVT